MTEHGTARTDVRQVSTVRIDPNAAVHVTFDPYTSVLSLALSGIRDLVHGRDTPMARVGRRMPERGRRALARAVTPGASVSPDLLSPADPGGDTDVPAEIDRIRGMSCAELQDDFVRTFDGAPPPHWEPVAEAPVRWARDVADALALLWSAVEPVWHREAELRGREAERVGAASARRALDIVLQNAHPRGHVEDGMLVFPDPEGRFTDARGRVIVLAPVLNRLDLSISNLDRTDLAWFAYPVPSGALPTADPGGLDALLTPVRATVLRALRGEWSMSRVAASAAIGASAATYHVDALVAAGLVERRRDGRRTLVRRSSRGDGLLDLYDNGSI